MKKEKDFTYSITVKGTAKESEKRINQVKQWWAKKYTGKSAKLNDKFSVFFGGPKDTFVDFKITELIPEKKIVWLVTNCNLHWINNTKEWKKNEVIWNLTEKNGKTKIDFVHKGMTPQSECYETCKPGWTHHIKDSLINLIEKGEGFPE